MLDNIINLYLLADNAGSVGRNINQIGVGTVLTVNNAESRSCAINNPFLLVYPVYRFQRSHNTDLHTTTRVPSQKPEQVIVRIMDNPEEIYIRIYPENRPAYTLSAMG